jgi:hypothetical protein
VAAPQFAAAQAAAQAVVQAAQAAVHAAPATGMERIIQNVVTQAAAGAGKTTKAVSPQPHAILKAAVQAVRAVQAARVVQARAVHAQAQLAVRQAQAAAVTQYPDSAATKRLCETPAAASIWWPPL